MVGSKDASGRSQESQDTGKPDFGDEEDPVNYLGFGIVSYFDLLKTMIVIFLVLFLIHIPVLKIYSSHTLFSDDVGWERSLKSMSLGNMGFSTTRCSSTSMQADKIILSCRESLVQKIVDFGIITKFEDRD